VRQKSSISNHERINPKTLSACVCVFVSHLLRLFVVNFIYQLSHINNFFFFFFFLSLSTSFLLVFQLFLNKFARISTHICNQKTSIFLSPFFIIIIKCNNAVCNKPFINFMYIKFFLSLYTLSIIIITAVQHSHTLNFEVIKKIFTPKSAPSRCRKKKPVEKNQLTFNPSSS
jgi:hypothetical protein